MTVSSSPRLGLTRWSVDNDPQNRTQFDNDNAQLDAYAARDEQGTLAARPAPGIRGRYYTETSASAGLPGVTWREDGTTYRALGSRVRGNSASTPVQILRCAVGQTANMLQLEDENGNPLAAFGATGILYGGMIQVGSQGSDFHGVYMYNASGVPGTPPTGQAWLYLSGGNLYFRGSSGVDRLLASA